MKLLVTGLAVCIGSVMTALLFESGHEVTIFDNLTRGQVWAVSAGASFIEGDWLHQEHVHALLTRSFDGVLLCAAPSLLGESVQQPVRYYRNNVVGTLYLLEAMHTARGTRLIFSSSAAVYGEPGEIPIRETAVARPTNPYGGSKLAVDQMIGIVATGYGVAAVSLRYFNVAGASEQLGVETMKHGW